MEERDLRNIAVFVSIAGVALLFLVSSYFEPAKKPVYAIGSSLAGSYVETSGVVAGVKSAGGVKIMELWNLSTITVPLFFDANPKVGDGAKVRGVVKNYKGTVELVPSGSRDIELQSAKPRFVRISEISDNDLYSPVLVRGFISDVSPKGDFLIATLNDSTGTLRIFLSEKSVSKGDFVEVSGIVKRYYSSLEMLPREMTVSKP